MKLAAAMVPLVRGGGAPANRRVTLETILGAYIESVERADVFKTDLRLEKASLNSPSGPQDAIKQEALWQRWEEEG